MTSRLGAGNPGGRRAPGMDMARPLARDVRATYHIHMNPPHRVVCDLCGRPVPPHAFYVVKIDVYADPSVPAMSTEELEEANYDETFAKLVEEMKHLTADDLQDDVHRRFEYRICRPCQRKFLANPLGKPRENRAGEN